MKRWTWVLLVAGVVVLGVGGFIVKQIYVYPKAQIAAAAQAGKPAPDFTLNDATGKPFTLSSQRGHRVVINFYRGYW
jgi:cytochrome oxidase Cu insertion factor (SCO1/SenC/PrrC family)